MKPREIFPHGVFCCEFTRAGNWTMENWDRSIFSFSRLASEDWEGLWMQHPIHPSWVERLWLFAADESASEFVASLSSGFQQPFWVG